MTEPSSINSNTRNDETSSFVSPTPQRKIAYPYHRTRSSPPLQALRHPRVVCKYIAQTQNQGLWYCISALNRESWETDDTLDILLVTIRDSHCVTRWARQRVHCTWPCKIWNPGRPSFAPTKWYSYIQSIKSPLYFHVILFLLYVYFSLLKCWGLNYILNSSM